MEERNLGWVERCREGGQIRLRGGGRDRGRRRKCVLSGWLQASIKAGKGSNSAAISVMCFDKVMTIDSAKKTCNYSRFHDQNTVCM